MKNFNLLLNNIKHIHLQLQDSAAKAVNKLLTIRNWLIGHYIVEYEQNGEDRAKYGAMLLEKLAFELKEQKLSLRHLQLSRQFYMTYPQLAKPIITAFDAMQIPQSPIAQLQSIDYQSVVAISPVKSLALPLDLMVPPDKLVTNLSFTHLIQLISIDDPLKRTFYEMEAIKGNWSVRELKRQINSLYFERMGLSQDKEKLARLAQETVEFPSRPTDVIKNVYMFEFLDLPQKALVEETDLEQALLDNLKEFLLELGNGFCFEGRQKRILIGDEYYFIDMVFYHRILKCHVLIELKIEEFTHANIGQLKTYLNYYRTKIQQPNDNAPVGILLVTNKNDALVEYAIASDDNTLFVSKYMLELPSKEQLVDFIRKELKRDGSN